ncbi:MAG: BLUF domain-containing protein [Janthinobacterium lividum]
MLHHLIYLSRATTAFDDQQLQQLLLEARARNQTLGITGILLYGQQQFLQVLEGEPAPVQALYAHIRQDPRHRDVTLYADKEITHRAFEGWAMAYHPQDPQQFQHFAGLISPAELRVEQTHLLQADQQLLQLLRSFVLP